MTLALPWRRAEPAEEDNGFCPDCGAPAVFSWKRIGYCKKHFAERSEDWERPVSAVHLAPLRPRWTTEPPTHAGVWWVRWPGYASKVVQVYSEGNRLHYGWTDVEPQPVVRDGGLEWSDRAIREPT